MKTISKQFYIQSWEISYWRSSYDGKDFSAKLKLVAVDNKDCTQYVSESFYSREEAEAWLNKQLEDDNE